MIAKKTFAPEKIATILVQLLTSCLMFILTFAGRYIGNICISSLIEGITIYEIPPLARIIIPRPNLFIGFLFALSFASLLVAVLSWRKSYPVYQSTIYFLYLAVWSLFVIGLTAPIVSIFDRLT